MLSYRSLGYKQITGLTTVKLLSDTTAIPAGTDAVLLQAETQNIRFRDDGEDPTTTVGMLLVAGQQPWLFQGRNLADLRFIQAAATAILNVTFCNITGA